MRFVFSFLLALTLVAASCGSSVEPSETTGNSASADGAIELEVRDGELVGGARRESASLGDAVTIVVTGDSTDMVHVHGYDRYIELQDGAGELTFDALIPGVFEVELEEAGVLLVQLAVS